jgi:hypothetical protein
MAHRADGAPRQDRQASELVLALTTDLVALGHDFGRLPHRHVDVFLVIQQLSAGHNLRRESFNA